MKKIVLAMIVVFVATACATMKPTERVVMSAFSDYRQYSADGFLISPSPYTYDFESVGELNIIINPAKIMTEKPSPYNGGAPIKTLDYESIEYSELVDMAVKEAREKGADAIVNFSISKEFVRDTQGYVREMFYEINGFCIKRK